jgi:hypothetical protein
MGTDGRLQQTTDRESAFPYDWSSRKSYEQFGQIWGFNNCALLKSESSVGQSRS